MYADDREGEYFADVDDNETDEPGSVFIDDEREVVEEEEEDPPGMPVDDDFASDTSSIIDELLCCGEDDGGMKRYHGNEVLGGAEVPLTPDLMGNLDGGGDGSRRVSIVNGLEEELPVPVIMVVMDYCGGIDIIARNRNKSIVDCDYFLYSPPLIILISSLII